MEDAAEERPMDRNSNGPQEPVRYPVDQKMLDATMAFMKERWAAERNISLEEVGRELAAFYLRPRGGE